MKRHDVRSGSIDDDDTPNFRRRVAHALVLFVLPAILGLPLGVHAISIGSTGPAAELDSRLLDPRYAADAAAYSGVVRLSITSGGIETLSCSGSLLFTRQHILTAQHCLFFSAFDGRVDVQFRPGGRSGLSTRRRTSSSRTPWMRPAST